MIADNLKEVRERIARAAARAGRDPSEITLVCVTKEASTAQIEEALASGVSDIGENRVQSALEKFAAIGQKVRWHMIGHLQRNKVKKAVELFDMIHSVDSLRLAQSIDRCSRELGKIFPVLLEVNISGEPNKYGFRPQDVANALKDISSMANIKAEGLMTMAPMADDAEKARPYFRRLRELRDKIYGLRILSMGMSQDFEVAIEEGAHIVRIGSAIFRRG